MKRWTEAAEKRLEEYLRERGVRASLDGVALEDVVQDWRLHVQEEVERDSATVVSVEVLDPILARLGPEEVMTEEAHPKVVEEVPQSGGVIQQMKSARKRRPLSWVFGVWFPIMIILFEWVTSFCASVFFDPIRTWVHGALLLSVPILNVFLLKALARGEVDRSRWLAVASGFAVVVTAFYAWLFVPLVPASIFALVAMGMGLLSLTPVFSFFVSISLWRASSGQANDQKRWSRLRWRGVAAGIIALLLLEAKPFMTRVSLITAMGEDREKSAQAIDSLRSFHDEKTLLLACYEGNRGGSIATDLSGWLFKGWSIPASMLGMHVVWETDGERAREVFYQVTGKSFNSVAPPRWTRGGALFDTRSGRSFEDFEWDDDLGGEQVAARVKGLTLEESRMDANLDAVSGLGYCEWTTVFKNVAAISREARFQVQLPPGGVASRVTLWINGEPREAAFASKGRVRKAYQEVAVQQRRDPVLVTACGPERILVQCFPVLPDGGEMKIRVGVTAPLHDGEMVFPQILERNFSVPEGVEHAIWLQSDVPFEMAGELSTSDGSVQSLQISQSFLESLDRVSLDEEKDVKEVYCVDPLADPSERVLIRERAKTDIEGVDLCVVVVDGSIGMREFAEELAEVFGSYEGEEKLRVILADDGSEVIDGGEIVKRDFGGGCDNVPALVQAIREARKVENGAVVWMHGPQPMKPRNIAMLDQLYERGRKQVPLYSLPLSSGGNRVLEELFKFRAVQAGPAIDDVEIDLKSFLASLLYGYEGERVFWSRRAEEPTDLPEVSDQLARWWAATQVRNAQRMQTPDPEKVAFAAKYQLVTAFSGAVVLETAEQYARHGLQPVDASSAAKIPVTPEPGVAVLLLLGTIMGMWRRKRE